MTQTVLLTLGRLSKALEIARALANAGCRVIIAEPFRRHVCKPSRYVTASYVVTAPNTDAGAYLREILSVIEKEQVDLVLPVSEEALHVAKLTDRLSEGVRFASEGFERLAVLHDKLAFVETGKKLGFKMPETYSASSQEAQLFTRAGNYVVKPVHSCSGLGLHLCEKGEALPEINVPAVVQRRIDGRHVSTCAITHKGRVIGNVAYEGTVFAGTVAVCFERVDDAPRIAEWVAAFADKTGYSGFLSFDFIIDEEGMPWPIECNPRVTSGVHFFDPPGLAAAILNPDDAQSIELKPRKRFQQAYSTLTEVYGHLLQPREYFRLLKELFTASDIVWNWRDPLPFVLMTPNSWDVLRPAIFEGVSMGEAAMRDIAWFGSETLAGDQSGFSEGIRISDKFHAG